MRTSYFERAFAGLLVATIGAVNAGAEPAGSANPREQMVYQTRGIVLDAREMAAWARASYWEQKVGSISKLTVDTRMQADPEERDAVLSTAWQLKPATIGTETKILAIIPRRGAKPHSKDLAYQITFSPIANVQGKVGVATRFVAEGPGVKPILISAPTTQAIPRLPASYLHAGFPFNNVAGYWTTHPDDLRNILGWVGSADPSFDQILMTRVFQFTTFRSTCFHVSGTRIPTGPIQKLTIEYLGETEPVTSEVPPQYDARDVADWQIEQMQSGAHETERRDKLGAVTGIAQLPVEERLPAKYAIWQYFGVGTQHAEVDAIVPVPDNDKRALLTLRFDANNDVSVRRIGEDRNGSWLRHVGDIRQTNGFAANSTDASKLTAWLKKRYPAATIAGNSVSELANSIAAEIRLKSGTPAWFKENYGIDILAAGEAQSQLSGQFQFKAQQLAGLQDFTPSELQMLEVTLEKMSDRLVSRFRGLKMARQKTAVEMIGVASAKLAINNPAEAGFALLRGNDRLIAIFDSSRLNSESLFIGGTGSGGTVEVADEEFMAFAHELGHILSAMPGAREGFNGVVKTKEIKPVTWYAAANPKDEFFPEAFALYLGDPEWLKGNRPDLFNLFETLGNR
jgi:hypothetical protein